MSDPGLVQAMDYILNRSDDASLDVLAAAVMRRRKELGMFGSPMDVPNPQRMAKEITEKINAGIGLSVDGLKKSVRDMAVRIIRQQAPELSDEQIEELSRAWIPENPGTGGGAEQGSGVKPPKDMLASMIEQFVSFSRGTMSKAEDNSLRAEMGAWPERYWNIFPQVIRLIITDFLKDRITEEEFNSKIGITLEM